MMGASAILVPAFAREVPVAGRMYHLSISPDALLADPDFWNSSNVPA